MRADSLDIGNLPYSVAPILDLEIFEWDEDRIPLFDGDHLLVVLDQERNL